MKRNATVYLGINNEDIECDVDYYYNEEDDDFELVSIHIVVFKNGIKTYYEAEFLRYTSFETIKKLCLEVYEEEKSGYL